MADHIAHHVPELEGRCVLVLGAGRSGLAAAALTRRHGANVVVADLRSAEQLAAEERRLHQIGASLHAGGNPASLAADCDLVIVSPGVPLQIELLDAVRRRGVAIWGEVELAARFCRGRVVGITGSNGKSTVTSMLGAILRGAGIPGGTGGNLDTPFCELLDSDSADAVHAVELSSFQIDSLDAMRPNVAVLLNISPDHLDRYGSYEEYARAKVRLFDLQDVGDVAIVNADDPECARFVQGTRAQLNEFSTRREVDNGAFLRRGRLIVRTARGEADILGVEELPVPGVHNQANALAAALAAYRVGCTPEAIAGGLRGFRPLAHRLEHVGDIGGVSFYNDSKATNPASTLCALDAFPVGTVHLILGGRDKGADWSELAGRLCSDVRQLLLIGEAAPRLEQILPDVTCVQCGDIETALRTGFDDADTGHVVLLSPGCASFDQYRSFEARGDDFRRCVALLRTESNDA